MSIPPKSSCKPTPAEGGSDAIALHTWSASFNDELLPVLFWQLCACLAKEARSGAAQGSKCSGKSPPEEPIFCQAAGSQRLWWQKQWVSTPNLSMWVPLLATTWWGLRCRIYAPVAWKVDETSERLLWKGLEWCFKVDYICSHNGPLPTWSKNTSPLKSNETKECQAISHPPKKTYTLPTRETLWLWRMNIKDPTSTWKFTSIYNDCTISKEWLPTLRCLNPAWIRGKVVTRLPQEPHLFDLQLCWTSLAKQLSFMCKACTSCSSRRSGAKPASAQKRRSVICNWWPLTLSCWCRNRHPQSEKCKQTLNKQLHAQIATRPTELPYQMCLDLDFDDLDFGTSNPWPNLLKN